jgi:hypothetical protein
MVAGAVWLLEVAQYRPCMLACRQKKARILFQLTYGK